MLNSNARCEGGKQAGAGEDDKRGSSSELAPKRLGMRPKVGPAGGGEAVGPTLGLTLGPTQRNAEWAALRSYRLPRNSKRKRESASPITCGEVRVTLNPFFERDNSMFVPLQRVWYVAISSDAATFCRLQRLQRFQHPVCGR
jgi:hypothetical protein